MKFPHCQEFLDMENIPYCLKATERELLEGINSFPFRRYSESVGKKILEYAARNEITRIVEMGAGSAPLTEWMIRQKESEGISFVVCDLLPDKERYRNMESRYPGRLQAVYDPVDYSEVRSWGENTLLVLSHTFHHIPESRRAAVISSLIHSADHVMVCEGLRKNIQSVLFCLFAPIACFFIPLLTIKRPGALRRIFFTWFFPVPVLMLVYDGIISSIRMWTDREWRAALKSAIEGEISVRTESRYFTQIIVWGRVPIRIDR